MKNTYKFSGKIAGNCEKFWICQSWKVGGLILVLEDLLTLIGSPVAEIYVRTGEKLNSLGLIGPWTSKKYFSSNYFATIKQCSKICFNKVHLSMYLPVHKMQKKFRSFGQGEFNWRLGESYS